MTIRLMFCYKPAYYYFNTKCNEKFDHNQTNAF